MVIIFLANKENQSYFLENNYFCQVICKYTSAIASQKMEVLVVYKAFQLFISKVNIKH